MAIVYNLMEAKYINIKNEIKKLAASVFKIDENAIKYNLTPDDIENWDSLSHIRLINKLEQQFKIGFDMEDVLSIEKIGDIEKKVKKYLENK